MEINTGITSEVFTIKSETKLIDIFNDIIFQTIIGAGIAVAVILCGMILGDFSAKGSQKLDYIIVLGAQVRENGPSVVLKYRLDTAIMYLEENPDTICIVSGGQGKNEPFSEAHGMATYMVQNGVASDRILIEDQSTNTIENIQQAILPAENS